MDTKPNPEPAKVVIHITEVLDPATVAREVESLMRSYARTKGAIA